jgi:siroheme synthase
VDATRPEQQVWRGTLDALARDEVALDGSGAGTIVVGDVVAIGLQDANRSPERLALQSNLGGQHVSRG